MYRLHKLKHAEIECGTGECDNNQNQEALSQDNEPQLRCIQCTMIQASLGKRLPTIEKSFAAFTAIYITFFGVFSFQRFHAWLDNKATNFDLPTYIIATLLVVECIYSLAVFYALFKGQEKRSTKSKDTNDQIPEQYQNLNEMIIDSNTNENKAPLIKEE